MKTSIFLLLLILIAVSKTTGKTGALLVVGNSEGTERIGIIAGKTA
jgi:hypothetical protein